MDGIYSVYMAGQAGVSQALLLIKDGILVGADVGGLKYDGEIEAKPDGTGFSCSVVYVIPAGASLITTANSPTEAMQIPLKFELPIDFAQGAPIRIETPLGPVNARFEKLRSLDNV